MITWKAVQHPNILPLLGVVMTGGRFAMVSQWMANGSIKEFIRAHPNENRYELVSSSSNLTLPLSIITALIVGRCHEGFDPHPQSRNDSQGPKGGMSWRACITHGLTFIPYRPTSLSMKMVTPAWRTSAYLRLNRTPRTLHHQTHFRGAGRSDGWAQSFSTQRNLVLQDVTW